MRSNMRLPFWLPPKPSSRLPSGNSVISETKSHVPMSCCCCARTTTGHAAAPLSAPRNSRRRRHLLVCPSREGTYQTRIARPERPVLTFTTGKSGDPPRGLWKSAYRSGQRTLGGDLGAVRVVPSADSYAAWAYSARFHTSSAFPPDEVRATPKAKSSPASLIIDHF